MSEKLFLDDLDELKRSMTKEAGYASRLGEAVENWPQEVLSDAMKQLPYLADYEVNPVLDRADGQRGFAFGFMDVSNKTERPEIEHDQMGLPHVRVPVVIQEHQMRPFSIYLDGERVMPLTEERLRESLFNPQTFDLSQQAPQDPSLVEPLMPPQRSGIGMGGEYKTASAREVALSLGLAAPVAVPMIAKDYQRAKAKTPGMPKVAFKHISKEQWNAIYQSQQVQALVHKCGSMQHPEVQNKIYEIASKEYGYHPKPYPPTPEQAMAMQHKATQTLQKRHDKAQQIQQKSTEHNVKQQQKMQQTSAKASASSAKTTPAPAGAPKVKTSSLLQAIAPTIRESDAREFVHKLASDPTLQAGFRPIAHTLIEVFDKTKRASVDARLTTLKDHIEPTVVTLQKLPGNCFLVKSANNNAFVPDEAAQGQVVPQEEAGEAIGQENAQQMAPGQTATAVADPVENSAPQENNGKPVEEFGEYKVRDLMGNTLMGWVFPEILAWDGSFSPQPIMLFSNGSAYAMQDTIIGELVGKGTNLPVEDPRGDGCFYYIDGGNAVSTAPVTIGSSMAGPDGTQQFQGTDAFGTPVKVSIQPGLRTPSRISDEEYALPDNWKFMRLNNQTQLLTDQPAGAESKTAAVKNYENGATLFYNGGYNVTGGCGLNKIASHFREDLDAVSAEFILGLLGVDGITAKQKVAEARKKGSVKLANLKTITLLSERYSEAEKRASSLVRHIPNLKRDLVKEAATLEDEGTIDKVLALNFINPDNVNTFVDYLPELEQTSERLAEMLLYSYLGVKELPESAVERSMKNIEDVATALKGMSHAEG